MQTDFTKLKEKWQKNHRFKIVESQKRKTELQTKAEPIFKKYNISKAILFGSVAEGRCNPESDIDLYVTPLSLIHI